MILLRFIRVEVTAKISSLVREELLSRFAILYNQDSSSDFDLKCGTKVFHVHKVVPVSRSDAFKAMFKEESLGKDILEDKKTQATIEDCEPETPSHLLKFMYKGRLQD
jgi:hypothetical protein